MTEPFKRGPLPDDVELASIYERVLESRGDPMEPRDTRKEHHIYPCACGKHAVVWPKFAVRWTTGK